jgi:putative ATP-dependent endonuclease of OLD family
MKLVEIKIDNYRGIHSLILPLDGLTVLIGENNVGKTTILEALKMVLTRGFGSRHTGQFTEYDFHLKDENATPQTSEPIKIIVHFAEETENEWPVTIIQQMNEIVQLGIDGLNHVWLRAEGAYNDDIASFETKWSFLNSNGDELILKNSTPLNLITRFVPLFFLSALRDASQEFGQRGQFWSSFLKSIQLPDEKRKELEIMLQEVNTSVIEANSRLAQVTQKLSDAKRLVPLDVQNPVILEAIPTRVFDMVGKIQVHLKSANGAKLPLYRHGEGTQSLSVLMLFQAFAAVNLAETYAPESIPILALEEPEAHLHPSAIRSLGTFLESMAGQIIVTSHSGDLVSRIPIKSIRRIYKVNDETKVGRVEDNYLTDREIQAINYNICLTRGYYLFSRCWLLLEGESDFHLMPLLFELMGYSLDQISISILEISQVIGKGEPLIKFAKALGIQWFLMADGDDAGTDYVTRSGGYLENNEILADRARNLTNPDIEHEFWYNGYDDFMINMVSQQRQNEINIEAAGNTKKKTKLLIKAAIRQAGGKPAFAQELASEIDKRGANTIPQTIQDIINRVVELAGG